MADPIFGRDAVILFYKGGGYFTYGCASDIEIQFSMETKSVKTIGDGVWKRKRGQNLGYQINLNGLLQIDDDIPVAFDLLDYFTNMTDIAFRMIFEDENLKVKVIEGNALPTNVNLGGGSDGHATGAITLEGNGQPDIRDVIEVCNAVITAAHTEVITGPLRKRIHIDSLSIGSPAISRWDYTINGGGTRTAFTDGNIPTQWDLSNSDGLLSMAIIITPICSNGLSGTPYSFTG